ncbi:hypothetical protein G3567_07590, partial [Psychroflexus sp. YR1-1]
PQQGYTDAGSYPITVSAAETANYLAASENVSLVIEPATQTGLVFADNSFTYDGSVKSLVVTGQASDATVTYANNDQIDAGTYAVTATVARPNYTTAVLNASLSINKAPQAITFNALATRSLENDSDFQLDAMASSGLEVTYTYAYTSAQPAATVTPSGFVELQTSGQIIVTASQAGNANFEAASPVQQALNITSSNSVSSSITIDGKTYDNPPALVYYLIGCDNSTTAVDVSLVTEVNAQVSTGPNFSIATPAPGVYRQEVVISSQDGTQTRTYMIMVEKAFDFDAIVVRKYNNTLVLNNNPETNGGYSFVSYKWYKNGRLVSEKQAFSEGDNINNVLDPNASYQAVMMTSSGDELRTCLGSVRASKTVNGLSLVQNPVQQGSALQAIAQYPEDELKDAIFQVYDLNGRLLVSVPVSGVENTIQLPYSMATGLYKLILITNQRQESISFIRN